MLLYNSIGPNPHVVRMFMAERDIKIPRQEIDILGGENRREAYLAINPTGQCPALRLHDGHVITEITAICEYLDEITPGQTLIGSTPEERAETRMWVRRIDLNVVEPIGNGFRYSQGLKMFHNRIHCIPAAAEDLKQIAQEWLTKFDRLMAGKEQVCGHRFTLADILLFCFLEFGVSVKQPLNRELTNLMAWHARMKARPSAAA